MIYEFLKDFQLAISALVTGSVGFAGVLYTMNRTAKHEEKRHAREAWRVRESVRAGLWAELKVIQGTFWDRTSPPKANIEDDDSAFVPKIDTPFFNANIERIGVLEHPELIEKIIYVYGTIESVQNTLSLYSVDIPRAPNCYVLPPESIKILAPIHEGVLGKLTDTLNALEAAQQPLP